MMPMLKQLRQRWWRTLKLYLPRVRSRKLSKLLPGAYLHGEGIEIGALHNPLSVPNGVRVRYVDRMSNEDLLKQYPDLQGQPLVPVSMVSDGERLTGIEDGSQDFIIASHFLEHCQNPIGTLIQFFRVLRPNGVAYLKIPDKRFTFDRERPLTTLQHVWDDHELGPECHRREHFEEYVRFVHHVTDDAEVQRQAQMLMDQDFSIHYHVWTQQEFLELLLSIRQPIGFEIESFCMNRHEMICVLRKDAERAHAKFVEKPVGFQRLDAAVGQSEPARRHQAPELIADLRRSA